MVQTNSLWQTVEIAAIYEFALAHAPSQRVDHEVTKALNAALNAVLKGEKDVETALAEAQMWANQAMTDPGQTRGDAPRQPVVVPTPEPEPSEEVVITFAPFFTDAAPYRELSRAFHDSYPEITVRVREPNFSERFGVKEMASFSDVFSGTTKLLTRNPRSISSTSILSWRPSRTFPWMTFTLKPWMPSTGERTSGRFRQRFR